MTLCNVYYTHCPLTEAGGAVNAESKKKISKSELFLNQNIPQNAYPHLMFMFPNKGSQWLSGRVLDSRPRDRGFEPHRRHCVVSLSKNIKPSLVLVLYTGENSRVCTYSLFVIYV